MVIFLLLLGAFFLGAMLFKVLNGRVTIKEGARDFLLYFAEQLGIYGKVDTRFLLSYEELWGWVEMLGDYLILPELSTSYFESMNGVLVISISHNGGKLIFHEKSILDQQRLISQSLVHYIRKTRGYILHRQSLYYQVWQPHFFELWIPLSDRGMRVIGELRHQRRK